MKTLTSRRLRTRSAVLLTMLAILAVAPSEAAAATSGGWSNLGHGATATTPAMTGKVETLSSVGSKLYVGGDFTNVAGLSKADHIATWDGSAWAALGNGLGDQTCAVFAIAVDTVTNTVFAGGSCQDVGGDGNADAIAKFNGGTWSSLSSTGLNGNVDALAIVGRTLYVGGGFDNVGGGNGSTNYMDEIAAYGIDSGVWSPITDATHGMTGTVAAIVPDGSGGIYVGGCCTNIGGSATADFLAHWTGGTTSWSGVGGTGLNDRVRALAINGSDLYVGGDFTNGGGVGEADKVAHYNGSTWSSLGGSSFFGEVGVSIYGLWADGPTVIAAGYFNNAGGLAKADGIAAFVGGSWTNVGTSADGTNGPVSLNTLETSVRVVGSKLYLGGLDSAIADANLSGYIASFNVRQPDNQIAAGTGAFIGNNKYNTTGANQTKSQTVKRTKTGTFSIKISNDGLGADSFTVKGAGSSGAFTATYFSGTTNITAQVVAGTYAINNLAAGGSRTLSLKVKVGSGAAVGSSKSFLVTTTSTGGGAPKDAIKATVKAS